MRPTSAMTALLGLLSGIVILLAPTAHAQTGYPPGACTVLAGTQSVGSITVGLRFIVQLTPTCVFTSGAAVTVVVNGVNIPSKTANASGFVLVDITAVSATQLSIDDPVLTPAVCGVNTVTARGPSTVAGGATVNQTANFTLNCVATTGATTGSTTGPPTPVTGRLSLTGANMVRWGSAALALVVVGSLFVLADRRRHQVRNASPFG